MVVVNESFVRAFWGEGANGVGRRIKSRARNAPWITVVGVAGDVKHYGLERPMRPGVYFPLARDPRPNMMLAIHTAVDPASVTPALREMLRQMDPEVPLYRVRTMEDADPAIDGAAGGVLLDARGVRVAGVRAGDRRRVWRGDVPRHPAHARDRHPRRARRPHRRHLPQRRRQRRQRRPGRRGLRSRRVGRRGRVAGRRAVRGQRARRRACCRS